MRCFHRLMRFESIVRAVICYFLLVSSATSYLRLVRIRHIFVTQMQPQCTAVSVEHQSEDRKISHWGN